MLPIKKFLDNSYLDPKSQKKIIGGYKRDDELSGRRVQVYTDQEGKAIVSHRGTQGFKDVLTDAKLAVGKLTGTDRYKHAKKIQQKAVEKYGKENITTLGHSLGGSIAERAGKISGNRVITYNKGVSPLDFSKKLPKKQTDIRSTGDLVSFSGKLQKGNKINLSHGYLNPLKIHSTKPLKGLKISY